jgi:hypothetical protein
MRTLKRPLSMSKITDVLMLLEDKMQKLPMFKSVHATRLQLRNGTSSTKTRLRRPEPRD